MKAKPNTQESKSLKIRQGFTFQSPLVQWGARIVAFFALNFALINLYWLITGGRPLPSGPGRYFVPAFIGGPAALEPLPPDQIPQHPFMAPNGVNNMHDNAYVSDTTLFAGPVGKAPRVISAAKSWPLGGQCASVTFDAQNRILTYCSGLGSTNLLLLDPHTLQTLDKLPLPQRPVNKTLNIQKIVKDTSGGAYFILDQERNVVLGLPDNTIKLIGVDESGGQPRLKLLREYDLEPALGPGDNKISAVLPDWAGNYWFVNRFGIIGVVNRESGAVKTLKLEGEEIQNSFAVDETGVYVLSNYALYKLRADDAGQPAILWRETYDRGARHKLGQIEQGSGTTPTLFGDGYVAITDNAEPRMNVLVYRRDADAPEAQRLICKIPVFKDGDSATENTLVGYERAIIVENNYGYDNFTTMVFGKHGHPGHARIDIRADESGCDLIWETYEVIGQTSVPKVSLPTGLLYIYAKAQFAPPLVDAFYWTGIDFRTGEVVFRILTGSGISFDNNGSPTTIGPDGTAYVGASNGIMAIQDADAAAPFNPVQVFNHRYGALIRMLVFILSAVIASRIGR